MAATTLGCGCATCRPFPRCAGPTWVHLRHTLVRWPRLYQPVPTLYQPPPQGRPTKRHEHPCLSLGVPTVPTLIGRNTLKEENSTTEGGGRPGWYTNRRTPSFAWEVGTGWYTRPELGAGDAFGFLVELGHALKPEGRGGVGRMSSIPTGEGAFSCDVITSKDPDLL